MTHSSLPPIILSFVNDIINCDIPRELLQEINRMVFHELHTTEFHPWLEVVEGGMIADKVSKLIRFKGR
jgi:hypothetical protein